MKLAILSCPRSGSKYTSYFLQGCGLDIHHEHNGDDGGVGYTMFAFPENLRDSTHIFHQVREPVATIASFHAMGHIELRRMSTRLGVPFDHRDRVIAGMQAWVSWNEACSREAEWTYRVEDLRPGTAVTRELFRKIDRDLPASWPNVPLNVNTRKHRKLTWTFLFKMAPTLSKKVVGLARKYGYETPEG